MPRDRDFSPDMTTLQQAPFVLPGQLRSPFPGQVRSPFPGQVRSPFPGQSRLIVPDHLRFVFLVPSGRGGFLRLDPLSGRPTRLARTGPRGEAPRQRRPLPRVG
jgi:hypothetical protein